MVRYIWVRVRLRHWLALGLYGWVWLFCFRVFSQYYPELFPPRNITVMRKQL